LAKLAIVSLEPGSTAPPRLLDMDSRLRDVSDSGHGVRLIPHAVNPSVSYLISEDGGTSLWMQPLDGSPGRVLTHFSSEQVSEYSWSPDGKTLAVTRFQNIADVVLLKEGNP